MSRTPFCFVHATNVRLDQPMWGIIGEVSGEARRLVEEATNLAFERVVDMCIEQDAAFLLLTGNTVDAAHSHRALMLLEQACERLAESDCQVFLMPGESDPPHAWRDNLLVSDNLTVCLPNLLNPVSVIRDGLTLATVGAYQDRQHSAEVPGTSDGLRVALIGGHQHAELQQELAHDSGGQLDIERLERFPNLAGLDYLALGIGNERTNVQIPCGLAHDPGCPQPLDGRKTSSHGCTIIEVDKEGRLQTRQLPTAIVLRDEIAVHLDRDQTWDDLVRAMQAALADRQPLLTERLWLIRWILDGEGEVLNSLRETETQKELAELVEAELTAQHGIQRCHEISVQTRWPDSLNIADAGSVYEEFRALMDEQTNDQLSQFRSGMASRDWPESNWVKYVIDAADQVTEGNIHTHARNLARRHLLGDRRDVA